MPPLVTFIARVSDGLPLVASFAQTQESLEDHKKQAKNILRGLSTRSVAKMSIETNSSKIFHYLIQENVCYLTLTEQAYPKRLAFLYLEEIADSFLEHILQQNPSSPSPMQVINQVAKPYAFIQYDITLQKKARDFRDPTSASNSTKLNQDLSDIHSIMKQNISQVLDRGEKLENVSEISNSLMDESKKFKWGAKKLGFWVKVEQYGPIVAICSFVIFVLGVKFYL